MEAVERDESGGCWKIFEGRECLRTSGRTSAWASSLPIGDCEARDGRFGLAFWTRRVTASLDSWRKYAPSAAANLPGRKLILWVSLSLSVDLALEILNAVYFYRLGLGNSCVCLFMNFSGLLLPFF